MMIAEDDKNPQGGRAIAHVIYNRAMNPNNRSRYGAYGNLDSDIRAIISAPNQFTPFSDKNTRFFAENIMEDPRWQEYYDYAGSVLGGKEKDITGGADFFALPSVQWGEGNPFGLSVAPQDLGMFGSHQFYKSYNQGGMAEKFSVDDAVAMIRANPQSFVGGGLVKKMAPKVLGKLTDFKPKLTGPDLARVRTDLYTPPKGPYTITNEDGVRVLDKTYENLDEAQAALKELAGLRMSDASTFKIFGKRPPKTPEGVNEAAPEVDLGMVGKELPPEKPGAMFWGSREKIIGAPSEAMTGKQWLQYLQLGKHGILNPKGFPIVKHMELNDTGLAPHLSKMGNKTVTKEQLVKDFDNKLAPEIDVVALGGSREDAGKIYNKVMKYDMQEYRPGPVKNVLQSIRNAGMPLKEAIENNNQQAISKIIDSIEGSVSRSDPFGCLYLNTNSR